VRILATSLTTAWAVASLAAAPSTLVDRVVAQVNDDVILLSQLNEEAGKSDRVLSRREVLDHIIDAVLLKQEAVRRGLTPPEEMIAQAVDQRLAEIQAGWPDPHTFDAYLAAQGMTLADLRRHLREDEADAWLRRSLIVAHMGAPPADLDLQPQYDLAQIVVACPPGAPDPVVQQTYQECLDLRAQVLEGADFGELAQRHSDDAVSRPLGGAIGLVEPSALDPGVAEALRGLDEGDMTVPVRTEQGWHLLAVRHLITPRQRWFMQEFETERAALAADLRRRAHIEIFVEE
jgi:peptidyl-prolyl cis-trans isomerase SurA